MRKGIYALLCLVFVLSAFADADYDHRKARMAPPMEDKAIISTHNDHVGVQLDDVTGKFNEGTYPDNQRLLYSYPSSPWSSWTMVRVDGTDYCNSAGALDLEITTPFELISHPGDSSYIWGGWTTDEGIEIMQKLQPVYIVYPDTIIGTVFIQYQVANTDDTCHEVGILLQMDTMIDSNDAAELATSRGYSGVEEGFSIDDELGMPPFWLAYEEGPSYSGTQLIGMGILSGWDAVTPDRFIVGQWGDLYDVEWPFSPDGMDYSDSAVRIYWLLDTLCPGDTVVVGTYYGLGKELRMGHINLIIEPVNINDCTFSPNPFNALLIFNNSTGMPISDVYAEIELPDWMSLATGAESQPITPEDLSSGGSGTSEWNIVITPPITDDDTIWFRVDSDDLDSASVAYYTMGLPDIGLPPYGDPEMVEPLPYTTSSCTEQGLYIPIVAANGLMMETVEFFVGADTITGADPRLTYRNDSLFFMPSAPWASGAFVEYGILDAEDERGCMLAAPVISSFVFDNEPPYAHDEMPEDASILGATTLDGVSIAITDDVREIDTTSLSFSLNDSIYYWGDPALSWDGERLTLDFATAGIVAEDGDTFNCALLTAADPMPDYCGPNEMESPYEWMFRINIIDLWLPDTFGYAGDTMYLYVDIENVTNMGITNLDIDINYFESVLDIIDVHNLGVTGPWPDLGWTAEDGVLSIRGSGDELTGGGHLLKIIAVIDSRAAGAYSRLDFLDATFNDGELASAPVDGFLTVLWNNFDFMGTLRFEAKNNERENRIAFGTSRGATEGYDSGLDLLMLPEVPGEITAFFDMDDPDYPHIAELRRDMKNSAELPVQWRGAATYDVDDSVEVSWHSDMLPPGLWRITYRTDAGEVTMSMKTNEHFFFRDATEFIILYDHPEIMRTDIDLCAGWNLMSLPYLPSAEVSVMDMIPYAITPAFYYDSIERTYVSTEMPEAGMGFWIYLTDATSFEMAGSQIESVNMPLMRGWNTIGMPMIEEGETAVITTVPEDLIISIYDYDACDTRAYTEPEEYQSGKGYFILSRGNGVISITVE